MVLGSCSTFKVIALLGFIWLELLWQSSDQIEIENTKSSTRTIASLVIKGLLIHLANVYDHTTLKAPHPARSAKLSNVGLTSVPESETVWEHAVS
ncbi:hypothetical protein T06_2393 [Trichinella sp. T6]|nr:hypothetical protein T06_2393 [Trichinella sp. T6]